MLQPEQCHELEPRSTRRIASLLPAKIERKNLDQMALAVNAQGLANGTSPAANVADVTEVALPGAYRREYRARKRLLCRRGEPTGA